MPRCIDEIYRRAVQNANGAKILWRCGISYPRLTEINGKWSWDKKLQTRDGLLIDNQKADLRGRVGIFWSTIFPLPADISGRRGNHETSARTRNPGAPEPDAVHTCAINVRD